MYKDKNIQITKCKLIPKIVGMRLSYVNIKDMNPKDPFVKRSELKRELAKLETRLTAVINTAVAKEPA
ncbi:hypothetical protein FACS1894218_4500 [Bacilli bacterium]|nr:hypothetical protein FACS1894218_4500 [Bacilli bacterium]